MSTTRYCDSAPSESRFGTGCDARGHRTRVVPPLASLGSELPAHVELAHLDPCGAVHDAVHYGVGVHAAPKPRVPVLLAELRAEDGGAGPVARLHELQQEAPEQLVRAVEEPLVQHEHLEGGVLADEL